MKGISIHNLLSKTTLVYLVFTLIAFFITAELLNMEFTSNIDRELEKRFRHEEHKTKRALESGYIRRKNPNTTIHQLTNKPDLALYPIYIDTMMVHRESEELILHRVKKTVVNFEDSYYEITMVSDMEDLIRMQEDIVEVMVPTFIILALVLLIFSVILSGYFFRPFNKILESMKTYKVGNPIRVNPTKTSTTEFRKMQDLFHRMVDKNEVDYRNIKEYTENMAHEIQTPLAVIRNKVENLMSDESVMEKHASEIKAIYNETNHISNLGTSLNLLTKIENEEFSSLEHITTKSVIENHVEAIQELVDLKMMTIETNLSDEHNLNIDPRLFAILIKNIIRNALHYGSSDGPIRIQTTNDSLIFSNYGDPLTVSADNIFDRFYKSDTSKTSLGLGLALVKKICEINKLKVTYHYEDGQHIFTVKK